MRLLHLQVQLVNLINVPVNYYPDDDPSKPPQNRWRSHAHLLYGNWLTEVYESTPFDLNEIGS